MNELDLKLRPQTFGEFVGQKAVTDNIIVFGDSAKRRGVVLDHILLSGPSGLGKTTLAYLVANMMNAEIKMTTGPEFQTVSEAGIILQELQTGSILFIDEIHGIPRKIEEYLYSAMEDFCVNLFLDRGHGAKPIRMKLPRFTLIGATIKEGKLSQPFRDRFGIQEKFELYTETELMQIIQRSEKILAITCDDDARAVIARSSRGTPRIANRLLKRVWDFCCSAGQTLIDSVSAVNGLARLGIDEQGLHKTDWLILKLLASAGNPLGLKTISSMVNEHVSTIEQRFEPWLMRNGLIFVTPQGRMITEKGRAIINGSN
jgi:Holliday junction DNA helicase RuvB